MNIDGDTQITTTLQDVVNRSSNPQAAHFPASLVQFIVKYPGASVTLWDGNQALGFASALEAFGASFYAEMRLHEVVWHTAKTFADLVPGDLIEVRFDSFTDTLRRPQCNLEIVRRGKNLMPNKEELLYVADPQQVAHIDSVLDELSSRSSSVFREIVQRLQKADGEN